MIPNVIWLDCSKRASFMKNSFTNKGDWFSSKLTSFPPNAEYVVAHFSDLVRVGQNHARVDAFKSALQSIEKNNTHPPLIVVYSGYTGNAISQEIKEWFLEYVPSSPSIHPLPGVYQNQIGVDKLKNFLEANVDKKVFFQKEQQLQTEQDITLATNLVAEIVAWLGLSADQEVPPEMEEYRSLLIEKFGKGGEKLVDALENKVGVKVDVSVKDCVNRTAEQIKSHRVEAWKRAGML